MGQLFVDDSTQEFTIENSHCIDVMSQTSTRCRNAAVFFAVVMIISVVSGIPVTAETIDGGTTTVSEAGSAPSIELSNATIDDDTESNIELAYNATGTLNSDDIKIRVTGVDFYAFANGTDHFNINTNISASEGVVNVTIPAGTFGGGQHTLDAALIEDSTGDFVATDTGNITTRSPIKLEEYTVSNTSVTVGENVTLSTTLNNTGDTAQEFTVAAYDRQRPREDKRVNLSAGEVRTVDINTSFSSTGERYIRVNLEGETNVTVEKQFQISNTSVSTDSTYTYQPISINATVTNEGDSTDDHGVVFRDNGLILDKQTVTLDPGESANVSLTHYFSYPDTHDIQVGDGTVQTITAEQNPVEVTDTQVNATAVNIGDTVRANISAKNTASNATARIIELQSGSRTLNTTTVVPAGDASVTASFTHTFQVGGTHAISGGEYSTAEKVVVSDPAVKVENYTVESTDVYAGDSVPVTVTLNNTVSDPKSFAVSTWSNKTGYLTSRTVSLDANEHKNVTLDRSLFRVGEHNVTVNEEPATPVTVKEGVSVTNVEVSETIVQPDETFQVNVTLENPTDKERSKFVNVWTGESKTKDVAVPAGELKQVSFDVAYNETGTQTLFAAGEQRTVTVINDTDGTANISIDRVFSPDEVVNGTSGYFYAEAVNDGDAPGVQNVTLSINGSVVDSSPVYVEPNSSSPVFLEHEFNEKGDYSGYINGSSSHAVTGTVRGSVVVDSSASITHVNGTEPDELPEIKPVYRGDSVNVQIVTDDRSRDLSDIGADESTVLRANFTVQNYTPRIMASTGQDLNWTTTSVGDNRTEVSVTASPSQLNFKTDFQGERPTNPSEWDSAVQNDTANFGYDAAILMRIGNAQGELFDADPEDLQGMTISTDAQLFDMPRYYPGDTSDDQRLEIGLAAPHKTVNGNLNDGYYEAFLPNSLLDAWNVSDPESELSADYSASDTNLTVTETNDGAYVSLSLHYSSGTVTVETTSDDSTDSDSTSDSDDTSDTDDTSSTDDTSTDDDTSSSDDTTDTDDPSSSDNTTDSEVTNTTNETDVPETETTESTETNTTETNTDTTNDSTTTTDSDEEQPENTSATSTDSTDDDTPGFGAVITLVALAMTALIATRRES